MKQEAEKEKKITRRKGKEKERDLEFVDGHRKTADRGGNMINSAIVLSVVHEKIAFGMTDHVHVFDTKADALKVRSTYGRGTIKLVVKVGREFFLSSRSECHSHHLL